jgi:hypothetical protein
LARSRVDSVEVRDEPLVFIDILTVLINRYQHCVEPQQTSPIWHYVYEYYLSSMGGEVYPYVDGPQQRYS